MHKRGKKGDVSTVFSCCACAPPCALSACADCCSRRRIESCSRFRCSASPFQVDCGVDTSVWKSEYEFDTSFHAAKNALKAGVRAVEALNTPALRGMRSEEAREVERRVPPVLRIL